MSGSPPKKSPSYVVIRWKKWLRILSRPPEHSSNCSGDIPVADFLEACYLRHELWDGRFTIATPSAASNLNLWMRKTFSALLSALRTWWLRTIDPSRQAGEGF
jgi:hypothetical protein